MEAPLGAREAVDRGGLERPARALGCHEVQPAQTRDRERRRARPWKTRPSEVERAAFAELGELRNEIHSDGWSARLQRTLVCSPAAGDLLAAAQESIDAMREGREFEILFRSPAWTAETFATLLFEHHDAICFWSSCSSLGHSAGTMYTYFGPRIWEFSKAFSRHGAVFLRGRGSVGPWMMRP